LSTVMLLSTLKDYENALLVLGLVFNIIMILFIIISILLIFSLLMNSVEQKSFENGIMRLVGLSKYDYMAMILTQALMFVLPSVIAGYLASIPMLWFGFTYLLHMESPSIVPDGSATAQAIFIGFFIPLVSSIIPIQKALQ
jgi:ABC-type antimicrobial peptide transport system permease subunit